MKNTFNLLGWMLILLLASVSFVSCGEDDDKPTENNNGYTGGSIGNGNDYGYGGGVTQNTLIGSWKYIWNGGGGYSLYTFNSDGTGSCLDVFNDYSTDNDSFTYQYSGSSLVISFSDDDDKDVITITFLSNDRIKADWGDNDIEIWDRFSVSDSDNDDTPGGSVTNIIVGSWKCVWGDDGSYSTMTFNADGTGVYMEVDYESENYTDYFTYQYSNSVLSIHWLEDDYWETTEVNFLTKDVFEADFDDGIMRWNRVK